jgi:hypothetical protein
MKWFALLGLLLFLGVAVAPSINAGMVKESIKKKTTTVTQSLSQLKGRIEKVNFSSLLNSMGPVESILRVIVALIGSSLFLIWFIGLELYFSFGLALHEIFQYMGENDILPQIAEILDFSLYSVFFLWLVGFGMLIIIFHDTLSNLLDIIFGPVVSEKIKCRINKFKNKVNFNPQQMTL